MPPCSQDHTHALLIGVVVERVHKAEFQQMGKGSEHTFRNPTVTASVSVYLWQGKYIASLCNAFRNPTVTAYKGIFKPSDRRKLLPCIPCSSSDRIAAVPV